MNEKLEYAMRYFELHAKQRINTFNFFVVLSALLISALVKTFEKDFGYPQIGYGVSIALMWLSIVFWRLDDRIRYLIKHAERNLGELEKEYVKTDDLFPDLFDSEDKKTTEASKGVWKGVLFHHMSYSQCFRLIYFMFFLTGFAGVFAAYLFN